MAWIGLIVGILIGAVIGQLPGALALGFLGWLVGFVMAAQKKPGAAVTPTAPVTTTKPEAPIHWSLANRLDAIERRLAVIERQIGVVPADVIIPAKAGIQDELVVPAKAGTQDAAQTPEPVVAPRAPSPPAPPRVPPPPREPAKPNPIIAWFLGGNTIVRVGLVVLFFGLAFLVKYGIDHRLIPVELRVAAVGAAGIALLVVGWRLRWRRAGYALSLQGAGIAVLYLTIFGSLKLYGLIPAPAAFVMLVVIAGLGAFLAVKQDSLVFAIFAAAGGFLAPILASTGHGSHVLLFSYYLMLNASIIYIAWFKAWRPLNLVGFLFTALIGLVWGLRSYRREYFDSTEPFLIAFFLMYLAIAILFARKATETTSKQAAVDGTIVFGTPIFAFGLQSGMLYHVEYGLAFTAIGAAAIYLVTTYFLLRADRERWHFLSECFLPLGVVFATLAIPLALDARWTSAAWALEGSAIVWVGLRQGRKLSRAFGLLLEVGAGVAFFDAYPRLPAGPPLSDALFIGAMIMSLAGLRTWRNLANKADTAAEKLIAPIAFVWGLLWLVWAGGHEIETFVDYDYRRAAWIAFMGAIALGFGLASLRFSWREARWPAFALPFVLIAFALLEMTLRAHPFGDGGWIAWPFAIASLYFLLKRAGPDEKGGLAIMLHVLSVALVCLVAALEIEWVAIDNTASGTAWALASRIVAPSIVLLLSSSKFADNRWPVRDHTAAYRIGAATLIVIAMALWSLHVNWSHAGGSDPLPYMPVLNALDLAHILAAMAVVSAVLAVKRSGLPRPDFLTPQIAWTSVGIVAFIWANSMLLRTIHHWADVPYRAPALWSSVLVQAALSVFWSVLALGLMVFATRKANRTIWMVGAALMGVVVAKLVFVDLSHLAGIERIVSFIGVGVLMLVIGYFSPVPPRRVEAA